MTDDTVALDTVEMADDEAVETAAEAPTFYEKSLTVAKERRLAHRLAAELLRAANTSEEVPGWLAGFGEKNRAHVYRALATMAADHETRSV